MAKSIKTESMLVTSGCLGERYNKVIALMVIWFPLRLIKMLENKWGDGYTV